MIYWFCRHDDTKVADALLPADAMLALSAHRVVVWKGIPTIVGRVECDELRVGDEVIAVGEAPICRGRITDMEQFQRVRDSAARGEEVGILFCQWSHYALPQNVRLYRLLAPP